MKHLIIKFILMFVLLQTNLTFAQQTLIKELPANRNDESLTEIRSRPEVLSVFPVYIERNILFSEETLFKIELSEDEFNITKMYVNHRDINSFLFYGTSGTNSLILSFLDDDIQGTFTTSNKVYAVETHGGEYYMVQLDHGSMHENCNNLESSHIQIISENDYTQEEKEDSISIDIQRSKNRHHDGSGDIKVLVLYTSAAANSVGNIYNTALLAEEESNISFANSEVNCKIEIVYIGKTDYVETNSTTDKNRFKITDDGYMDEVHILRERYAADVCVLLVKYSGGICGEAYTIKAQRDEAFCVVNVLCATGYYSFIHEIGHLIGCRHNPENDWHDTPFEYGHGYIYPDGRWRTIMAYDTYCDNCNRIPYWSNPHITYDGVPMGTTGVCNNAKVWNIRYGEVGAFENISSNVTINSATIPSSLNYGFIEAGSYVGTNGNVYLHGGQSLTIKAGDEIVFSDGFEASAGSELNAYVSQQSATLYTTAPLSPSIEVAPVRHIDATKKKNTVVLYPNPTMDELYIRINGDEYPSKIVIMDVMGRPIMKLDNPTDVINISRVSAGTYFIEIVFKKYSERYKIIKR